MSGFKIPLDFSHENFYETNHITFDEDYDEESADKFNRASISDFIKLLVGSQTGSFIPDDRFGFSLENCHFHNPNSKDEIKGKKIGGKSDIEHIWHIHPNGSDPSPQDFKTLSGWRREGYTGIPFLIDTENNRVTFYNEKGNIIKVKYEDFIRMGHQDIIK